MSKHLITIRGLRVSEYVEPPPPDPPPPTGGNNIEFVSSNFDIPEDARMSEVITLRRNGSSTGRVVALVTFTPGTALLKKHYSVFDRYAVWLNGDTEDKVIPLDVFFDTRSTTAKQLTCTITSLPADANGNFAIGTQSNCTITITKRCGSRGITNVGSKAALDSAISSALPGDIIMLQDGDYSGSNDWQFNGNGGTSSDYIVVTTQTPGGATIDRTDLQFVINSPYWVVDGFNIHNTTNRPAVKLQKDYSRFMNLYIYNSGVGSGQNHTFEWRGEVSYSSLDKCEFHTTDGIRNDGTALPNKKQNWLYYCHFHGGHKGSNNLDWLQDSTQRGGSYETIFHRCLWDNFCSSNASETWSLKSADPIIRYNTVKDLALRLNYRIPRRALTHHSFFLDGGGNFGYIGDQHKMINCYVDGYDSAGPSSSGRDNHNINLPSGSHLPGDTSAGSVIWPSYSCEWQYCNFIDPYEICFNVNYNYGADFHGFTCQYKVTTSNVRNSILWADSSSSPIVDDQTDSVSTGNLGFINCHAYQENGLYGDLPASVPRGAMNLTYDSTLDMYRINVNCVNLIGKAQPQSDPLAQRDIFMRPRDPLTPDIGCEEFLDESIWPIANYPLTPSDVGPDDS